MILLDTHTWIWWNSAPEKLSKKAHQIIQQAQKESQIGITTISCWELTMLVARGRIGFSMDIEDWITQGLQFPGVRLLDMTPKIAVLATRLAGTPPNDPVDRLLIATANVHAVPLLSKDEHILKYPHVKAIW